MSRGAVFKFSRGHGRGEVVIRCAEDDTTRECAQAVLPLLQTLMSNRGAAAGDGGESGPQPKPAQ